MKNQQICSSCGGKFDDTLAKCPFCGTLNIPAAEDEYMEKLEDVREDLADLQAVPTQEVKAAIGRSGKFVKRVVIVVLIMAVIVVAAVVGFNWWVNYDLATGTEMTTEEYLWREENYPKWDTLYEEGKYEELMETIHTASDEDHIVWEWEHYNFCIMYDNIESALNHIAKDAEEGKLNSSGYKLLLYEQWRVKGMELYGELTEEELEALRPMAEPVLADFETRWGFTEEEYNEMYQELQESEGYVSFDTIEDFLKDWQKRQ